MGNVVGFINIVTSGSQEDGVKFKLFGNVDDIVGVIANYAQVISFIGIIPAGATILSLLKDAFSGGPSDRDVLNSISQQLDQLIHFEHGSQQHLDMLDIDRIVGKAADRLQTLLTAPDPDVNRTETIQDTLDAANFLGNRDVWTRPFFEELVWPRGETSGDTIIHGQWFSHTSQSLKPPVDGSGFVFDPRLSFPGYMMAIEIRGSVLPILHPSDFQQIFAQEFSQTADTLQDRYKETLGGFITARIPTPSEVVTTGATPGGGTEVIRVWGGTFGVVDIFSGTALLGRYPTETILFIPPLGLDDELYSALKVRLTLGTFTRKKALYIAHGLDRAWEVIQKLKQLAGRNDIDKIDREAVWSLREIAAVFGTLFDDPEAPSLVHVTAGVVISKLARLASLPTAKGLSLRSALDKATP